MIASPKPAAISIAVDRMRKNCAKLEAASVGTQRSCPLIAVYTGQSPSGSGLLTSRKYGSPRSELSPMTTHDAFQSAAGAPFSPGVCTSCCALISSADGMSRTRSTGVTVSNLSGSAASKKLR